MTITRIHRMSSYAIKTTNVRDGQKSLVLANARGSESQLLVHRFAMVGPGDDVRLGGMPSSPTLVIRTKGPSRDIVVIPHFEMHEEVRFGDEKLRVLLTEVNSDSHLKEYRRLEQFHYKGVDLQQGVDGAESSPKAAGGRRAILLAVINKAGTSRAVGYIELQMPLLMCKPRHDLFARPFHHPEKGVAWRTWLGDGQQYVNRIARIARVVVDPEFRGVGISTLLVDATKAFCTDRWHIAGEKPLFLEISAEMLRYMDFVSRAGFHFIGNTEGNLQRIAKDLHSIQMGAGGKSGIMSLQRKYHTAFTTYCEKTGKTFDEARLILTELLKSEDPRSKMASDEWLAFRPILRFPIPYYLVGLDEHSDAYVKAGLKERSTESERTYDHDTLGSTRSVDTLRFKRVQVEVEYDIPLTPYVRLVMDSFGIDTHRIRARVLGPADVTLTRGSVTLITGASGAGKSMLMSAIGGHAMATGLRRHAAEFPPNLKTVSLQPLPDGVPIFQYFAEQHGPDRAFMALCQVGLSEAMIFIKPFELLSMGQRYRAMFASLLLSDADVWLIDEFCSNLDPITSKVISLRLRRISRREQKYVVVAAANTSHFVDALMPDHVLVVRTGGAVMDMRLKDYKNGFFDKGF